MGGRLLPGYKLWQPARAAINCKTHEHKHLHQLFRITICLYSLLMNSKNISLYLLCFAAGNPKGAPTALKIANYILRK